MANHLVITSTKLCKCFSYQWHGNLNDWYDHRVWIHTWVSLIHFHSLHLMQVEWLLGDMLWAIALQCEFHPRWEARPRQLFQKEGFHVKILHLICSLLLSWEWFGRRLWPGALKTDGPFESKTVSTLGIRFGYQSAVNVEVAIIWCLRDWNLERVRKLEK